MTTSSTTATATNDIPAEVDARLTVLLERLVRRSGIHHANLAVMSGDGQRRWAGAAGHADEDVPALTPDTPFFIASVTKRFIITLVLQAHERGELHLDTPVTELLPPSVTDGLHVLGGVDHTRAVTVRHLASHTSGLPDYFDRPREGKSLYRQLAAGDDRAWTFDDVVRMAREQHRPHFPPQDLSAPRQRARYSDTGFQLLIRILETVTGRPFAELLDERVITPAGLEHTWLPGRSAPVVPTPAPSTIHRGTVPRHLPLMIESCNDLISTTGDLLRFQRCLLASHLFRDPHTVGLLTERRNRLRNAPVLKYGLGTMFFRVQRLAAPGRHPVTLVGHSGATGTWLFHCPELDLHLAGTIDQARGQAAPFRIMTRMLRAW
jgi:D-alanyl-D-alanine carboxypeptidase